MAANASFGRRNQQSPASYRSEDGISGNSRYKSEDRKPAQALPQVWPLRHEAPT